MKCLSYAVTIVSILALVFLSCAKTKWEPGMPIPKEKLQIAVIHPNNIDSDSLYDYAHYIGTVEMQKNIGLADSQITRRFNVIETDPATTEGAIRDSIAEGANIIIAPGWGYMNICEKLADEFPSVFFIQATGYKYNDHNFANYATRLYQAYYLSGIVAGMRTETGKIGFVAAMGNENCEVTRGINAFAIGVQKVNPSARVYVNVTHNWYDPMGETNSANDLIAYGCDVIAQHSNTPSPQIAAQKAGVWGIGFNCDMSKEAPDAVITSVVSLWGRLYTQFMEKIIDGTFTPASYFYGYAEGAVDITPLNEKLAAPGTETVVQAARQRLNEGYNIFDGVLETNSGRLIGEEGKTLSDEVIIDGINWYYKNVVVIK